MTTYICTLQALSKTVNGTCILKETHLSFLNNAKIGVIGSNGAGKSTLLRIIAGHDKEYDGELLIANGVKVGYLPQEPYLDYNKNVFDNIVSGLSEKTNLIREFYEIANLFVQDLTDERMSELLIRQSELQEQIDLCDAWNLEREIEIAMNALQCPHKDADIATLSGGEKRRVAICRLLLEKPDILLLDEPTNHLDAESVSWLDNYLKSYKNTVILVTHDRYFLNNVVEWILEIDRGTCIPYRGNYSQWLKNKEERIAMQKKNDDARSKQLQRELEWIQQSPKARHVKSKARIESYSNLLEEYNNTNRNKTNITSQIVIAYSTRLGDLVINVDNIAKSYNDELLFSNCSFNIQAGAIVGIIGPNGSGKTTLFNIIAGKLAPDIGSVVIGPTVQLGYVDQIRDKLNDDNTVWEEISDGAEELYVGKRVIKTRPYCAAFNFKGTDQQKKLSQLSGGERNRVHMAKLLRYGSNVIMLDEPTNDLDLDTLRALEDAILDFPGCVLVISHDRWFLNRIATHIIHVSNGKVIYFNGNYQDYCDYLELTGNNISDTNIKYKHKKLYNDQYKSRK